MPWGRRLLEGILRRVGGAGGGVGRPHVTPPGSIIGWLPKIVGGGGLRSIGDGAGKTIICGTPTDGLTILVYFGGVRRKGRRDMVNVLIIPQSGMPT